MSNTSRVVWIVRGDRLERMRVLAEVSVEADAGQAPALSSLLADGGVIARAVVMDVEGQTLATLGDVDDLVPVATLALAMASVASPLGLGPCEGGTFGARSVVLRRGMTCAYVAADGVSAVRASQRIEQALERDVP